ncbi:MAG: hypothetical protein HY280_00650 [Nitrospinae bacterium]|nr:hypothetical protein [Nitrospinota bacterium]
MLSSLHQDKRFDHLYEHNVLFRQLTEEHKKLHLEADQLAKAFHLSSDLEMKQLELKKRKLDIKEKLDSMLKSQYP